MPDFPPLSALRRRLTPASAPLLAAAMDVAATRDTPLYLVGGALRDLLRSGGPRHFADLDLAFEGDVAALADAIQAVLPSAIGERAVLTTHDRFGTATLRLPGATIDLARTRRERYARSGALPQVTPAPIEDDLARRDFSVNAMALALSGPQRGTLLDLFDGQHDLARGLIRVLHTRSFEDDPTRLIRACRYAARIDGRMAPATQRAARMALPVLQRLSPSRFGEAWRRLLSDPAATGALRRVHRLGLASAWEQSWSMSPRLIVAFDRTVQAGAEGPEAFWALTGLTLPPDVSGRRLQAALVRRCVLRREEREAMEAGTALRDLQAMLTQRAIRPSQLATALRPLPDAALRAAEILWRRWAAARIAKYRREWRTVESPLDAAALHELGVATGPDLGRWIARLRDARLDGELPPGRGAARMARLWVQSAGDPP